MNSFVKSVQILIIFFAVYDLLTYTKLKLAFQVLVVMDKLYAFLIALAVVRQQEARVPLIMCKMF